MNLKGISDSPLEGTSWAACL